MALLLQNPTSPTRRASRPWSLNLHYDQLIVDAVPTHARTALDVGCGDGYLSARLCDRGLAVTALDRDLASVRAAAKADDRVEAVAGDLCQAPLAGRTYDLVGSNAMLHHVDAVAGIRAMRELVAPNGTLAIVGFAQTERPGEIARAMLGHGVKLMQRARAEAHAHNAPTVWPPTVTFDTMREIAATELPGSRFRLLLSSRYLLTWSVV